MKTFQALVVDKNGEKDVSVNLQKLTADDLPEGEVLIKVRYSSVNFKDGLASIPNGNIVSTYPIVPGIDLAGTIEDPGSSQFSSGDEVIVTSYGLGVSQHGGYSEYARVPAEWIVPLPEGLTQKESMIFGTAGFTAALSVLRLEEEGITPDSGPVLVTGATGGVGSMAVAMLAKLGYEVVASTGSESEVDYLKRIGASEVMSRDELKPEKIRPLDKQRWAGAVDPVGGEPLAYILSTMKYGGSVAVSGLTAGTKVPTTVFPFILRGVNLVGIDSVNCPMDRRQSVWKRLASDLKIEQHLHDIGDEITLNELPDTLSSILEGKVRGRKIVSI
ncbi:NADPH:quinone oxidoreductase family protein [Alteribacillus iranensis]|uniref:Putative quinone oxidoreductase, YhdH/YhfP family n=1 Tax=Alteribacillus iranensis TaxID=930128 RepID=A0A1I2BAZ2_9BACI|nr:acryloyl-CoA reductase [Alteribacillus iranensis]SFE53382.1 putative quinone oxidoreductase, YhdH/YhfP family [Alteribacillus iranensis]